MTWIACKYIDESSHEVPLCLWKTAFLNTY